MPDPFATALDQNRPSEPYEVIATIDVIENFLSYIAPDARHCGAVIGVLLEAVRRELVVERARLAAHAFRH